MRRATILLEIKSSCNKNVQPPTSTHATPPHSHACNPHTCNILEVRVEINSFFDFLTDLLIIFLQSLFADITVRHPFGYRSLWL